MKVNKAKILIIEDDAAIREGLNELFVSEGFEVKLAENGQKGIEALHSFEPNLIFLDLMMPVMDGRSFLIAYRSDPNFRRVPVVLLTAAGEKGASGLDVAEVATKPVDIERLLEIAEKYSN